MNRRVALTAAAAVAFELAGCQTFFGPNIGEGARDREVQRKAAPVIVALERFHHDHGRYPTKIQELVPRYIADESALGQGLFSYTARGDGYQIGYGYEVGIPRGFGGVNEGEYDSKTKKWTFSGYM